MGWIHAPGTIDAYRMFQNAQAFKKLAWTVSVQRMAEKEGIHTMHVIGGEGLQNSNCGRSRSVSSP